MQDSMLELPEEPEPRRHPWRKVRWSLGVIAVAALGALGYYHLILDWKARPFCHKQIQLAFRIWMGENKGQAFPNAAGKSDASLSEIRDLMGGSMRWATNYNYVPGLQADDPGELILMYVNRPTRWTWHGPPATIFKEKKWIVVPLDFAMTPRPRSEGGELSERVSEADFRRRLELTLQYLQTRNRPYWSNVVEEHTRFLESLPRSQSN